MKVTNVHLLIFIFVKNYGDRRIINYSINYLLPVIILMRDSERLLKGILNRKLETQHPSSEEREKKQ